jgi:hypothetical protein
MTARLGASVPCSEPDRLAGRRARHFAHKVEVSRHGDMHRVELPSGRLELEPGDGALAVSVSAPDDEALCRVRDVTESHLVRFARPEELQVIWHTESRDARADEQRPDHERLELAALEWIGSYWNAQHLVRTRDWVMSLHPRADAALRIAALTHDIERQVAGGPRAMGKSFSDPGFLREHSARSADVVGEWLAEHGADGGLIEAVRALVLAHETGGWADADVLQAADSLSFLELNPELPARWVREGRATVEEAEAKLVWMHDRIRVDDARRIAAPLRDRAIERLRQAVAA